MSGGVDSSVAAALLVKQGYDVIGVTYRTWPKEECGASFGRACCNLEAITRARAVAEQLKIPYYVFDFSQEFKDKVIDYFCASYLKGLTPNPCVVCNEKIKFASLLDKSKALDAQHIATGHYVRKGHFRSRFFLKCGRDKEKDQSYFLFSLSQDQIRSAVFPLGGLTKKKVRQIAARMGLHAFDAPSSQDVCFISDAHYADYIKKKTGVEMREGDIVDMHGNHLGRHKGIPYYTIGQRRGLGIAYKEPLYVTAIDIARNRIIVGTKNDVTKKSLLAEGLNWVAMSKIVEPLRVSAMIRYNHKPARAYVMPLGGDLVRVDFDEPQEAPTPGQAVVFYDRDIVIGGGWIKEAL